MTKIATPILDAEGDSNTIGFAGVTTKLPVKKFLAKCKGHSNVRYSGKLRAFFFKYNNNELCVPYSSVQNIIHFVGGKWVN